MTKNKKNDEKINTNDETGEKNRARKKKHREKLWLREQLAPRKNVREKQCLHRKNMIKIQK